MTTNCAFACDRSSFRYNQSVLHAASATVTG
jgi:hypothetical protein